MPTISVIIPVYNRSTLLSRAVQSVLKQTFKDFELIIIDDCSDENLETLAVLNSDSRIIFQRLPWRSGVSFARNTGVHRSGGKWVAFLDSDDEWQKEKLAQQIKWLDLHPSYEIMQSREVWIRNGKRVNSPKTHEKSEGDLFDASLDRCMITPSSVILSRKLFDEHHGFNESLPACEDYDLWLRICSHKPVGLIDQHLLTRYGGHDDQLSGSISILDRFRVRSILQLIEHTPLTDEQYRMAVSVLVKKTFIIAQGYLKRKNEELYERYIAIARRFN